MPKISQLSYFYKVRHSIAPRINRPNTIFQQPGNRYIARTTARSSVCQSTLSPHTKPLTFFASLLHTINNTQTCSVSTTTATSRTPWTSSRTTTQASVSAIFHNLQRLRCGVFELTICLLPTGHELLAGAAAALAMREWQKKQERDGQPQSFVSPLAL
jgi:hypothetical protein